MFLSVKTSTNLSPAELNTKQVPLLHELQLGEQLNECVHQTRRADFALMLAMLADDVREQSQFILPSSQQINSPSNTEQALRAQLELAKAAPISLETMDDISSFNQAQLVQANDLETLRLQNHLNPKAISFRNDAKHIDTQVMTNTSVHCQAKHKQGQSKTVMNQTLSFNAKLWLNAVQQSLVKAPLVA